MINELGHHFEWHRRDICSEACRFNHVNGMANAGREYFGFPIVVVVDFDDVGDELQAILSNIIKSADERADVGRAGLGSENCLSGGKTQRDVNLDTPRMLIAA